MMVYLHGQSDYPSLKYADVLFLAGNPWSDKNPGFEHIALVAYPKSPKSSQQWRDVKVYALPESVEDGPSGPRLRLATAKSWAIYVKPREAGEESPYGHPATVWNLAMRPQVDPVLAEQRMLSAAFETGMQYRYDRYHVYVSEVDGIRYTNCVGFVVDMLSRTYKVKREVHAAPSPVRLLVPEFPQEYQAPYPPTPRRHPCAGHLAHSLDRREHDTPYGLNFTKEQAESTAFAKAFLIGKLRELSPGEVAEN